MLKGGGPEKTMEGRWGGGGGAIAQMYLPMKESLPRPVSLSPSQPIGNALAFPMGWDGDNDTGLGRDSFPNCTAGYRFAPKTIPSATNVCELSSETCGLYS